MRWIFFSLLAANIAVAIWGFFFKPSAVPVSFDEAIAPVTKKVAPTPALSVKGDEARVGKSAASSEAALCELVGPFDDDALAENFQKRLASIDIVSFVQHVELPAGASYWVHLAPESSREAAFRRLATLQAQDVESYVIGSGELKNAVSLGVFSVEALADARMDALKRLGLAPVKSAFERKEIELWIEIHPEEAEKMSDLTWARMMEGLRSQERRQNFCLPVAS